MEECLEFGPDCRGTVEYHSLYGGRAFPRCEFHFELALERAEEINQRYPYHQPEDFDPDYAGERWDDD